MHRQPFVIELLEDLVISQRAATQGGHRSLDYVPGQTLLGACAARLYQALGERAYGVFHTGLVRFGNAYCLDTQGRPTWPVPLCWHQRKVDEAAGHNRLDDGTVFNFQHGDPRDLLGGDQPKQLRDRYVSADGALHKPDRVMRMKTAIEPGTGRAAQAQFFGYEALTRGTSLGGWIEADAAVDAALFQRIIAALTGPLLLGRSRSAEYGQARFTPAEPGFTPPEPGSAAPQDPDGRQPVTLWLLSDLALLDINGEPTLEPTPAHLDVGTGVVDWERTFIRARRYAPWNGKRGAPDLERWVIQQGSVIRLKLNPSLGRSTLHAQCSSGLGLYRECGLGRVWVDPPLLEEVQPTSFQAADHRSETPDHSGHAQDQAARDPLILWLKDQAVGEGNRERVEREARDLAKEFGERVRQARRERGVDQTDAFGPSRSQWGRVMETARVKPGGEILAALFQGDEAVIKPRAEGWQESFFDQTRPTSLAAWIEGKLRAVPDAKDLPRLVQRLAHHCRTDLERRAQ